MMSIMTRNNITWQKLTPVYIFLGVRYYAEKRDNKMAILEASWPVGPKVFEQVSSWIIHFKRIIYQLHNNLDIHVVFNNSITYPCWLEHSLWLVWAIR